MKEAIQLMRDGFITLSSGHADVPVRVNMSIEEHGGRALFMPVYSKNHDQVGLKSVTVNPTNPANGLPFIHAIVTLHDAQTGIPLALMDGEFITSLRTGAGAGLATDLLSRPKSSVLAIFGTGVQAHTQVAAVCAVRPIKKILVFGRSPKNTKIFVKQIAKRYNLEIVAAKSADVLTEADIVCTATTSLTPVFADKHLSPGTHINGIGSYRPDMTEISSEVIARAKVVVDQRKACLCEAGDLIVPIQQGHFNESHIHAELGEILMNDAEGRTDDSEITFFKSVGNAIQDLVVANFIEKRAREINLGTVVTL